MDKLLDSLEKLAATARGESPGTVDVSGNVIARLRAAEIKSNAPLEVFALGALALAIVAALAAMPAFGLMSDPLWDMLQAAATIW